MCLPSQKIEITFASFHKYISGNIPYLSKDLFMKIQRGFETDFDTLLSIYGLYHHHHLLCKG